MSVKSVDKSVLIWYFPHEMYALVTAVEQYPQFLPWCDRARIVSSDAGGAVAEVGIAFGGITQRFTTRNEHIEGRRVTMRLLDGPFSSLDGQWSFEPLGDGTQRACKVVLSLHYGFDNPALGALVGPVFDKIAATLVDAFVKRAGQIYGA